MKQQKFKQKVKIELVKAGLTARQLADYMGISPQNLSNKMRGTGKAGNNEQILNAIKELKDEQ
jgi:transcriptional regulator with XRE-family HTH domain